MQADRIWNDAKGWVCRSCGAKIKQVLANKENPPAPLLYRHYKGGIYEIITDGTLENDPLGENSHVIVYRSMQSGRVWVRSRTEFYGITEFGKYRFQRVEEDGSLFDYRKYPQNGGS